MARSSQNEEVEANVALLTKWIRFIDEFEPYDTWGTRRRGKSVKSRKEKRFSLTTRYIAREGAVLERLHAKWLTGMHLPPAPDCPQSERGAQSAIANFLGCCRRCLSCQAEARLSLKFMLDRELGKEPGRQFTELVDRRIRQVSVTPRTVRQMPTRAESLQRFKEIAAPFLEPSPRGAAAPPKLDVSKGAWLPTRAAAKLVRISQPGLRNAKRTEHESPAGKYFEDSKGRQSRKSDRGYLYFYQPSLVAECPAKEADG
jgi:hypothetical protein